MRKEQRYYKNVLAKLKNSIEIFKDNVEEISHKAEKLK